MFGQETSGKLGHKLHHPDIFKDGKEKPKWTLDYYLLSRESSIYPPIVCLIKYQSPVLGIIPATEFPPERDKHH